MKVKKSYIALLVGLLGVVALIFVYQYYYNPNVDKTEALRQKNSAAAVEIARLEALNEKMDEYIALTKENNNEVNTILDVYPSNVLPEDDIKFAYSVETAKLDKFLFINTLGFTEPSQIYVTGAMSSASQYSDYPIYGLHSSGVTYSFATTYDGLKRFVREIYANDGRHAIESINVAVDSGTGLLSGTILSDSYFVTGTGKLYTEPKLDKVLLGTDNIFGTIEINIDSKEKTGADKTATDKNAATDKKAATEKTEKK